MLGLSIHSTRSRMPFMPLVLSKQGEIMSSLISCRRNQSRSLDTAADRRSGQVFRRDGKGQLYRGCQGRGYLREQALLEIPIRECLCNRRIERKSLEG